MHTNLPLFLLLGIVLSTSAAEASVINVEASQNNYVRDGNGFKDQVQNPAQEMQLAARGGGSNRKVYLQFDLSSLALTPGGINSVSLNLTLADNPLIGPADPTERELMLFGFVGPDSSFDQGTITWDNAPYNNATSNSFDGVGTNVLSLGSVFIDANASGLGGTTITWSSAALVDFLKDHADSVITLAITSRGGTGFNFLSKESGSLEAGTSPYLSVDAVIPEPSAGAFAIGAVLLALTAFAARRKNANGCAQSAK